MRYTVLRDEIRHLNEAAADFLTVNMGATAIGTGICAEAVYFSWEAVAL